MPRLLNLFAGRGNLQLEAENNLVLEVGAKQLFWNGRIEGDLVWFRNDMGNMIVFRPASGGGTQDQNSVSFVSHGIEAALTANLSKELTVSMDYTYIDQMFENRGDDIFNDDYHQLNTRWHYQATWGLGLSLQGSYANFGTPSKPTISSTVGEDSFFLLNGKLSYSVSKGVPPYLTVKKYLGRQLFTSLKISSTRSSLFLWSFGQILITFPSILDMPRFARWTKLPRACQIKICYDSPLSVLAISASCRTLLLVTYLANQYECVWVY